MKFNITLNRDEYNGFRGALLDMREGLRVGYNAEHRRLYFRYAVVCELLADKTKFKYEQEDAHTKRRISITLCQVLLLHDACEHWVSVQTEKGDTHPYYPMVMLMEVYMKLDDMVAGLVPITGLEDDTSKTPFKRFKTTLKTLKIK